ncbi:MAG: dethiobiotin synthase, partial [Oscillospiraceae bacterium]|nr:dethiobiotin synthase [Oscillospiraceae bacterium]
VVEGSGGSICPIRYDEEAEIFLEDIIKALGLDVIIVADAGLGTINSTLLTVKYLKSKNIKIKGIILNRYHGGVMENDNIKMIEELSDVPVIALVAEGASDIEIDADTLKRVFEKDGK